MRDIERLPSELLLSIFNYVFSYPGVNLYDYESLKFVSKRFYDMIRPMYRDRWYFNNIQCLPKPNDC